MRDVDVDVDDRLVHVGAGCLLKHVDAATQEHGLAAALGFVSKTGVAGLTLGGGFGYLTRRFGWTVAAYWRGEFLPGLSPGLKGAVRDAAQRVTSPKSQTIMFHLGDAIAERPDDGAVDNRDARYVGAFAASGEPGGTAPLHIDWARDAGKTLRPFSTGARRR